MTENNSDIFFQLMLGILIFGFAVLAILAFVIHIYIPFKNERDYIYMEIKRSDIDEKKYWKKELKLFYISYIPIVGRMILRRMRKKKKREFNLR